MRLIHHYGETFIAPDVDPMSNQRESRRQPDGAIQMLYRRRFYVVRRHDHISTYIRRQVPAGVYVLHGVQNMDETLPCLVSVPIQG